METPTDAMSLASSEMPPGLSLTITLKVISLPSAARPLSRHLPSRVVSMLPPHRGRTTLNVVIVSELVKKNYTIQVESPKFKSKVLFQSLIPKDWHLEWLYSATNSVQDCDKVVSKSSSYFFPFSSGSSPAITAARPVAPAPSTTAFSSSMRRRMAMEIHASLTVTILSIRGPPVARALTPTVGTVKPWKYYLVTSPSGF